MALIDTEIEKPSEIEAEEQKQNIIEEAVPQEPESSKIPEKYSGKSLEDIVKMHQEAEKLIGRQAQEVGEMRKLADQLIQQNLNKEQPVAKQETEIDFFEDPKTAVQKAVETHPDIIAAREAAKQFKLMQTQQMLQQKHPDYAEVIAEAEFQEWVKASPIRLNMFTIADKQYDFQAADELLSTFKQIRSVKTQQTADAGQKVLKQNLKAAAVDVGGTGESSAKIYRRADLIRLKMTDPDRYEQLQPEIMKAYAEGRVR
jgi:hypothetical protein